MIYADNAATTPLAPEAFESMLPFLQNNYGNASQPYSYARAAKDALANSRQIIADCINADPDEIYFTSGGTESDNWALKGIMFEYGDCRALLTSQIEHHAILNSAAAIERMGYPVAYLPVNDRGILLPETLSDIISDRTKLVSVMMANNEIGTIEPIRELAQIAHRHGALFHTDAVQAIGHLPVDVKALGVDMLSASAHKFNGPKGIGFLYVKRGTHLSPYNNGGSQEKGMRAGTENIASIAGMATALQMNCQRLYRVREHLLNLEDRLLSKLHEAEIVFQRNGDTNHIPGNLSVSFAGIKGETLLHRLDLMGICVSTGAACDSKETQISHVLEAIGLNEQLALGTIRISLGSGNTISEIDKIVSALKKIGVSKR